MYKASLWVSTYSFLKYTLIYLVDLVPFHTFFMRFTCILSLVFFFLKYLAFPLLYNTSLFCIFIANIFLVISCFMISHSIYLVSYIYCFILLSCLAFFCACSRYQFEQKTGCHALSEVLHFTQALLVPKLQWKLMSSAPLVTYFMLLTTILTYLKRDR